MEEEAGEDRRVMATWGDLGESAAGVVSVE